MKERVILFSDAVIAIIMTVMVVEFPVKISHGQVELWPLFTTIGIYFISFCFVANVWFQTAQRFNKVEYVTNKDLVIYLISLFLLSLVPKATDVLIEETSQSTLLMYGILTFLVVFFTENLMNTLTEQAVAEKQTSEEELQRARKRSIFSLFARLLLLLVGLFLPRFSLVVYMVFPILDFLQNAVDHEEADFLEQMGSEQKEFYQEDQRELWKNNWQKYGTLVKSALEDGRGGPGGFQGRGRPAWWQNVDRQWNTRLSSELDQLNQRLQQTTDSNEAALIQKEIDRINQEQEKIQSKIAATQQRFQERQGQEQERLQKRLEPIEKDIANLEEQLKHESDPDKRQKLQEKVQSAQDQYQKELNSSQERTQRNAQQAQQRMNHISQSRFGGGRPPQNQPKEVGDGKSDEKEK